MCFWGMVVWGVWCDFDWFEFNQFVEGGGCRAMVGGGVGWVWVILGIGWGWLVDWDGEGLGLRSRVNVDWLSRMALDGVRMEVGWVWVGGEGSGEMKFVCNYGSDSSRRLANSRS